MDGLDGVRHLRAAAEVVGPAEGGPPDQEGPEPAGRAELPPDCPVVPLGKLGDVHHYLDANRQLVGLKAEKHGRLALLGLFGERPEWAVQHWPRKAQDKRTGEWIVTGFRPEECAMDLMAACAGRGLWSPFQRVRGAGAWAGEDGELVLHAGGRVYVFPAEGDNPWGRLRAAAPGVLGRFVYPAGAPGPRPLEERAPGGEGGPAGQLLEILKTWRFKRGEVDAVLLLGWIGAAMLSGALEWRPLAWVTGGAGTGKSTLQDDVIEAVLGDGGLVHVQEASAAGIWQKLKYDALPVVLDEQENEEDNRKLNNLLKLARLAASGGLVLRGGADHEGVQFMARSCFLFSSILVPPLLRQDRSRMVILELGELAKGAKPPPIDRRRMAAIGRALRRRLVDGWPRFAPTLEAYRQALAEAGHSRRGGDVWGTLLACADLLLHDYPPSGDELAAWGEKLRVEGLAELEDVSDEMHCLHHLLTSLLDVVRNGVRYQVGWWAKRAAEMEMATPADAADANQVLVNFGLKRVRHEGEHWLAVANSHRGLAKLYEGTHWGSRSGAQGVWVQALRRLPHRVPPKPIWLGGPCRVTLLPLELITGGGQRSDAPPAGGAAGASPPEITPGAAPTAQRTPPPSYSGSADRDCFELGDD